MAQDHGIMGCYETGSVYFGTQREYPTQRDFQQAIEKEDEILIYEPGIREILGRWCIGRNAVYTDNDCPDHSHFHVVYKAGRGVWKGWQYGDF